jgi:hypothetical protein
MSDIATDLNGADKVAAQSPRNGFETEFQLDHYLQYARIAALDSEGNILGATPAVDTSSKMITELDYNVTEVTKAGSKSISAAVPSMAAITIPHAASFTEPPSTVGSYLQSPVALSTGGGFVLCIVAIV